MKSHKEYEEEFTEKTEVSFHFRYNKTRVPGGWIVREHIESKYRDCPDVLSGVFVPFPIDNQAVNQKLTDLEDLFESCMKYINKNSTDIRKIDSPAGTLNVINETNAIVQDLYKRVKKLENAAPKRFKVSRLNADKQPVELVEVKEGE